MIRLSIIAVVCGVASAQALADVENGFVPLFDGETLNGWTTANGGPVTRGWEVQDGALVRTGRGQSIYSKRGFANFDLRFEWRIAQRGNSGVKYRVAKYEPGLFGRPGWLGYEYQIWDDNHHNTQASTSAAAVYLLQAPSNNKQLQPIDQFNSARIVAIGPHLEHWLNGEKVVDVDTSTHEWRQRIDETKFGQVDEIFKNTSGRLMLQDHGNQVWFRNIRIREIAKK